MTTMENMLKHPWVQPASLVRGPNPTKTSNALSFLSRRSKLRARTLTCTGRRRCEGWYINVIITQRSITAFYGFQVRPRSGLLAAHGIAHRLQVFSVKASLPENIGASIENVFYCANYIVVNEQAADTVTPLETLLKETKITVSSSRPKNVRLAQKM